MIDLYLKVNTEKELIEALPFARVESKDGEIWVKDTHSYSLDLIGTIYNDDGEFDEDGEVIKAPTVIKGYHANIRCKESIAQLIDKSVILDIDPKNPKRKFA